MYAREIAKGFKSFHEIISYTNYNDNFKDYQGGNQSTHNKNFITN
jgi:hypothetical protein